MIINNVVRPVFPFTAIIGQHNIKISLLLNVLDPKIGGVMVIGDRGCGKSTTIRALIDLLPIIEVVSGDPFHSHPIDQEIISNEVRKRKRVGEIFITKFKKTPIVNIPLGATEDRVCGTIDIEQALINGIKAFEAGLLAQANRGILYIDEVNLLDDHLIDVLLDSAASGWNVVEREGISVTHPAAFILIGSGNPEEGEIRPQLLDRFGLHARIETIRNPELRATIVTRREIFDRSPSEFRQKWKIYQKDIRIIVRVRSDMIKIKHIIISFCYRILIRKFCRTLNVDGLRGDMAITRAIIAYKTLLIRVVECTGHIYQYLFNNKTDRLKYYLYIANTKNGTTTSTKIPKPVDIFRYVTLRDLKQITPLALLHRMRKDPLQTSNLNNCTLISQIINERSRGPNILTR